MKQMLYIGTRGKYNGGKLMKKFIALTLIILALFLLLTGCKDYDKDNDKDYDNEETVSGTESENTFSVTFIQEGQKSIIRNVEKGGTLTDIPVPVSKKGYTVKWDRTDFTNITEDLIVNVEETANTYKIIYNLGSHDKDEKAYILSREQTVTYDESFNVYIPRFDGDPFVGLVISGTDTEFTDGIYTTDDDILLTAIWKSDVDPESDWTTPF